MKRSKLFQHRHIIESNKLHKHYKNSPNMKLFLWQAISNGTKVFENASNLTKNESFWECIKIGKMLFGWSLISFCTSELRSASFYYKFLNQVLVLCCLILLIRSSMCAKSSFSVILSHVKIPDLSKKSTDRDY